MELKQISKDLNIPEEEVLSHSIQSYLDRELKNAYIEINKFKLKYQAISPRELEKKIESGLVAAHPGWEDAIEWANLQQRVEKIKKWEQRTFTAS